MKFNSLIPELTVEDIEQKKNYIDILQFKVEYERRKEFMGEGYINFDIAKATYRKVSDDWKLFWMRRDMKWHGYELAMFHDDIESVFRFVDEDQSGAFWG